MSNDSKELIIENIFTFLENNKGIKNAKSLYEIKIKKVNEIIDTTYIIKIYDKTTLELNDRLIYKNYSKISESINNSCELPVSQNLSSKILFKDPKNSYRIEEYISNSKRLTRSNQFQSDIIEQIIQILISYSLIASIFTFTLKCEDQLNSKFKILINSLNKELEDDDYNNQFLKNNFFDMCFKDLYEQALNTFKIFALKFKARCIKCTDKTIFEEFQKLEFFINNFKHLFKLSFPTNGLMTINHNDFGQRKLILKDDLKINFIENDFSCLNIIGFDIVNYLNLHCLINVFWVLHCSFYLDFEKYIQNEGFDYFQHAIDRIKLYEKVSDKKEEEEEENLDDDFSNDDYDYSESLSNED